MSEPSKDPKLEELELNRETFADLTPDEAENAQGGAFQVGAALSAKWCPTGGKQGYSYRCPSTVCG